MDETPFTPPPLANLLRGLLFRDLHGPVSIVPAPPYEGRGEEWSLTPFQKSASRAIDSPSPLPDERAPRGTLYDLAVPSAPGEEISLADLPEVDVPLPDPPTTVYVRALFLDSATPVAGGSNVPGWGTWLGGMDLSNGFTREAALTPVRLVLGAVTRHEVPLLALRRVTVTVTMTATPLGDGEGSLSVAASRVPVLPPRATTYGYGIVPCVDVRSGPQRVDIQVVGSGTFFVAGFFDDLGIVTPGQMPPGTMLTVRDVDLTTGAATFDRLELAPSQYSAAMSLVLGYVAPLPRDAGIPGPNSCADLGY
jgi:hypothetical protein